MTNDPSSSAGPAEKSGPAVRAEDDGPKRVEHGDRRELLAGLVGWLPSRDDGGNPDREAGGPEEVGEGETEDVEVWAVYDLYEFKLKGGFPSEEAAEHWLTLHPPFDLIDEEGYAEGRAATAAEADLILQGRAGWSKRPSPREEFVICYDLDP